MNTTYVRDRIGHIRYIQIEYVLDRELDDPFFSDLRSDPDPFVKMDLRSDPLTLLRKGSTIRSNPILFDPFPILFRSFSDSYRSYLLTLYHTKLSSM